MLQEVHRYGLGVPSDPSIPKLHRSRQHALLGLSPEGNRSTNATIVSMYIAQSPDHCDHHRESNASQKAPVTDGRQLPFIRGR